MWRIKLNIYLPLLLCLVRNSNGSARIDPLVETNVGLIRGLRATDGDYSMFMGIPYATVDGANPFGPSTPHPKFEEVFEAYDDSAICPQTEEFNNTIVGNLDCLHLNIYVPNSANSRNRMPVLVWIHGGSFSIGFSGRFLYGPKFLVRHDIILVSINYRLGPYGFMCLDNPKVPGNQGLKDQQLALKWIKNNIDAFGGDSNRITIYGESAGSVAVDHQFIYGDQNLFDKMIMHSGTAASFWAISEPDTLAPLKLAEHLGYQTPDINTALTFLATVDTHLVIASAETLSLTFWPCIENKFDNVESFIYDHPKNIKNLNAANKSVLFAYNHDERLLNYIDLPPESYQNMNIFYNSLRNFNFNDDSLAEMESIVRHFYIGDEDFSPAVNNELAKFESDFEFNYPTVRRIQKYLEISCKNIFHFVFSYNGNRNFVKHLTNQLSIEGAMHADEIGYLFDISYMDNPTPEDQLAIDRITTLWANFVKYGNPTPEITDVLPVKWLPVTANTLNYLELDSNVNIGRRHFKERNSFWDLFFKIYERSQYGYAKSEQ